MKPIRCRVIEIREQQLAAACGTGAASFTGYLAILSPIGSTDFFLSAYLPYGAQNLTKGALTAEGTQMLGILIWANKYGHVIGVKLSKDQQNLEQVYAN